METFFPSAATGTNSTTLPPLALSPMTILGALIPSYLSPILGYSGVSNALPHIVTFFVISTAAATGWSYWYYMLADVFRRFFMSTAQVRSHDELYEHVMAWVAEQEFSSRTRNFVATVAFGSLFAEGAGNSDEGETGAESDVDPEMAYWERSRRAPLRFTPAPGLHFFRYKGRMIMLERVVETNEKAWITQEILEFSMMGREPALLKEMMKEARSKYLMKDKSKTVVYRPKAADGAGTPLSWARCLARPSRPLSTVVLEQKQKEMFVDDIRDYLEPGTQKWYSDRGIPYRRGYLLHGPPGTGKSSLSFAVAGLLGLKVYVLSLTSKTLSDSGLASLFDALPTRCVVLLEDIDTITITQSRKPNESAGETTTKKSKDEEKDTQVSLSGLLNVIDGVASPEGRVLILTTNHPEHLDAALIRPGRVDMKIEFKLAGAEAIAGLFSRMYEDYNCRTEVPVVVDDDEKLTVSTGLLTPPHTPNSSTATTTTAAAVEEKRRVEEKERIRIARQKEVHLKEMAATFTRAMPEGVFSPADIQGYLLLHKNRPERAVEGAQKWVEDRIEARRAGKID